MREAFTRCSATCPARRAPTQIYEDDVLFLEWKATDATRVEDGIDTFVFGDGSIRVQTVRYTLIRS